MCSFIYNRLKGGLLDDLKQVEREDGKQEGRGGACSWWRGTFVTHMHRWPKCLWKKMGCSPL